MINLGLTSDEEVRMRTALFGHHDIKIIVQLLDNSHNYIDDLTDRFMDGNITVDTTQDTASRALDLTLLDPTLAVHLDAETTASTAVYVAFMISIIYRVIEPGGGKSWDIPAFCGPIDDVDRSGPFLTLKCIGKERLLNDTLYHSQTYAKNIRKTDLIKNILRAGGENKMQVPTLPDRTTAQINLKRGESVPWASIKSVASGEAHQAFYNGRGTAVVRPTPSAAQMVIGADSIEKPPTVGYDLSTASNAIQVIGATAKGTKQKYTWRSIADASHPLAPGRMGRNGKPRYLNPIFIEDSNLNSLAKVRKKAEDTLDAAMVEQIDYELDMLPNPLIEELDIVWIAWEDFFFKVRLRKFSIPLRNSGVTTLGYFRRVRPVGKPKLTAVGTWR
jgi:hypothetical protein